MTDYQPRIITTFESSDALTVVTFPRAEYEWDSAQGLLVPAAPLVGAGYSYDQLGNAQAIPQSGQETLRFVVLETDPATVDTTTDQIVARCLLMGRGKLYTTDSAGTRRWAWARAMALPDMRWSAGDIFTRAMSVGFRRDSPWYSTTQTVSSNAVNASPTTFSVSNSGLQRVYNAIILLKGTWNGPIHIQNTTSGYGFVYDGGDSGASNNEQVYFDSGSGRCFRSHDAGVTWSDVDDNLALDAGQAQQMRIDPGSNSFTVTDGGSPTATVEIKFYPIP